MPSPGATAAMRRLTDLTGRRFAAWTRAATAAHVLVEVAGFLTDDDPRLTG